MAGNTTLHPFIVIVKVREMKARQHSYKMYFSFCTVFIPYTLWKLSRTKYAKEGKQFLTKIRKLGLNNTLEGEDAHLKRLKTTKY